MCGLPFVSLRREWYARLYDSEMSERKITHFSDKPTTRQLRILATNALRDMPGARSREAVSLLWSYGFRGPRSLFYRFGMCCRRIWLRSKAEDYRKGGLSGEAFLETTLPPGRRRQGSLSAITSYRWSEWCFLFCLGPCPSWTFFGPSFLSCRRPRRGQFPYPGPWK